MTYKVALLYDLKSNLIEADDWVKVHCKSYIDDEHSNNYISIVKVSESKYAFQIVYSFEDEKDAALFMLRWG